LWVFPSGSSGISSRNTRKNELKTKPTKRHEVHNFLLMISEFDKNRSIKSQTGNRKNKQEAKEKKFIVT
jgi:hypothetical protein